MLPKSKLFQPIPTPSSSGNESSSSDSTQPSPPAMASKNSRPDVIPRRPPSCPPGAEKSSAPAPPHRPPSRPRLTTCAFFGMTILCRPRRHRLRRHHRHRHLRPLGRLGNISRRRTTSKRGRHIIYPDRRVVPYAPRTLCLPSYNILSVPPASSKNRSVAFISLSK